MIEGIVDSDSRQRTEVFILQVAWHTLDSEAVWTR